MTEKKPARRKVEVIPASVVHAEWRKDPAYRAAYDALEEEFSLLSAMIKARKASRLSQVEIAERMQTTQPAVARLEGGAHRASMKTLRSYAKATGHWLKITLEPLPDSLKSAK